jgi:hypothetical protein
LLRSSLITIVANNQDFIIAKNGFFDFVSFISLGIF